MVINNNNQTDTTPAAEEKKSNLIVNIDNKNNHKSGLKDYIAHNYNAKYQEQHVTILKNEQHYHEQANFCYVYANPDGYSVPDGI